MPSTKGGRSSAKCKSYQLNGKKDNNKKRKLKHRIAKFPNDTEAKKRYKELGGVL